MDRLSMIVSNGASAIAANARSGRHSGSTRSQATRPIVIGKDSGQRGKWIRFLTETNGTHQPQRHPAPRHWTTRQS